MKGINKIKVITIIVVLVILGFSAYHIGGGNNQATVINADISAIAFAHTDENEGEDLIITSDKRVYQGFSGATVYFSINPLLKGEEEIAMQFYFTDLNAKIVQIYQKRDNAWWALPLSQGEVTDSEFSKSVTRKKQIEGKIYTQSKTSYNSTGDREFFMAEIAYTPGTPGQFLIEALGESGSYGILDPWYDSGWDYRKKISVNPGKVSGGHTNFPMLFSRTDPDLRDTVAGGHVASSTGGDILFTDENQNKIPHEIEYYASTTGQLIAWVNVPFVSSTSTRDIYIYYGNDTVPLANQENKTGTWDSNYKGVWHLKETDIDAGSGDIKDSTSNANNGATSGMDTSDQVSGKVDGSLDFDGSNDQVLVGNSSSLTVTSDITISAWLYPRTNSDTTYGAAIVEKECSSWDGYWLFLDNRFPTFLGDNAIVAGTTAVTLNTWNHVVVTFSDSSNLVSFYVNTVPTSIASTITSLTTCSDDLAIGQRGEVDFTVVFDGAIDEVRVSATARSADWIATEYNNQSSPNTFYSYSGEGVNIRSSSVAGVKIRGGPSAASNWYDSGWDYRKKITINPQYVAGGHTNFPMLFSRTDPDLRDTVALGHVASSTGGDILFTDANQNKIPHEIEYYASTTGQLIAWVNVPFVSSTSTRDVYIYYGNDTVPLANQQDVTGTWDSSFKGVWHLADNAVNTTVAESTSNANTGTFDVNTNTKTTTGQIGNGLTWSNYADLATAASLNITGNITLSAWIKTSSSGRILFGGYNDISPWPGYGLSVGVGVGFKIGYWSGAKGSWVAGDTTVTDNIWRYVVVTVDGTTARFYMNGVADGTPASNNPNTYSGIRTLGNTTSHNNAFIGILDEVRISATQRSADWIKTEYDNQSSPNTFYSYSGEGIRTQSASTPTTKIRGGVKFR